MNDTKRGIAFYVETVLLVLFLSVALTVLVQVFAAAQRMGIQAQQLSDGTLLAENTAELLAASDSEAQFRSWMHAEDAGAICQRYEIQEGVVREAEEGPYSLEVHLQQENALVQAQIDVRVEEKLVYSLQTAASWQGE